MRCPFLTLATHADVWLDPWAKWAHRVLSTYRKLIRSDRALACKILAQARKFQPRENDTRNGAPVVLARIFKELQWEPTGGNFVFRRQNDVGFDLTFGSQNFFLPNPKDQSDNVYFCSRRSDMTIFGTFATAPLIYHSWDSLWIMTWLTQSFQWRLLISSKPFQWVFHTRVEFLGFCSPVLCLMAPANLKQAFPPTTNVSIAVSRLLIYTFLEIVPICPSQKLMCRCLIPVGQPESFLKMI